MLKIKLFFARGRLKHPWLKRRDANVCHVGAQNNSKLWPMCCIIIELNSQKTFFCFVLCTDMAMTSGESHLYAFAMTERATFLIWKYSVVAEAEISLVFLAFEPLSKWLARVRMNNSDAFKQIFTRQSEM